MIEGRPRIHVAGVAETTPVATDNRAIPEMVLEAVEGALADAALGFGDIEAAVTASVDLHDGLTASNIAVTEVVGAVMGPETRISGDGLGALAHAACLVWAGAHDTVIVVAHGKASMANQDDISRWALDPVSLQRLGIGFLAIAGMQATAVAAGDPAGPDAAVRRWADRAAELGGCTVAQVLGSPVTASPLRSLMAAPEADSAAAVILQRAPGLNVGEDMPAGLPTVELTGVGYDLDAHEPGDRDLTSWPGLARALDRAMRGATSVRSERNSNESTATTGFDEVAACVRFPHEEELFTAATGLSPTRTLFDGVAPVAAGIGQLISATRHLRSTPGRALAHGTWGPAGQAHAIAVLESAR